MWTDDISYSVSHSCCEMDSKLPPEPRRQDAGGDALGSPSGSDNNDDGDEPGSEEKVNANTTIDDGNTSSSGSSEGDGRASMPSQSRIEPEECDGTYLS